MEDVIAARIRRAEELLVSTETGVEGVARACGYQNVEHFCRQFRSRTGRTPLQCRRGSRAGDSGGFRNVAGAEASRGSGGR